MTEHDELVAGATANITHRCSGMSFATLERFLDDLELEITTGRTAPGLNAHHAAQALSPLPDGSKLQVIKLVRNTLLSLGRYKGSPPPAPPPKPEPVRGPGITLHSIRATGWQKRETRA